MPSVRAASIRYPTHKFGADVTGWRFLSETPEKTKPVLKAYDEWTKLLPKGEGERVGSLGNCFQAIKQFQRFFRRKRVGIDFPQRFESRMGRRFRFLVRGK